FTRASDKDSPTARPACSAASFKAAMRGPPEPLVARTNGRSGSTHCLSAGSIACAARKRRIGQRGSQTETMRDMIVLHYPFARPSVAATFEMQMPSRMCEQPEAVARGFGGADAPARCRGACFQRRCGAQQQKRQAAIMGRQLQFLTGLEIELVDHANDGRRRARMQSFRKRPERLFAMRRFGE